MKDIERDNHSTGLRERKKQRTRKLLHEAAMQLVEQRGLEGATVDEICDGAGVSPRTFFNYFPSKAAAVLNLPERIAPAVTEAHFRSVEGGLVAALCELIGNSMYAHVDRHRMKALVIRRPELLPAFHQWMVSVKEELTGLAEERARTSDDATAAVALVLAALGLMVQDDPSADHPTATRLREAVGRLVAVESAPMTVGSRAP